MISFAQNYEDLILARLFTGRAQGRYVDIGAHFPLIDSVTEHFYRLGWRGINVEPLDAAFAELCSSRPGDLNLHCAVGATAGTSRFFALDGYSTLDGSIAAAHEAEGRVSQETVVETMTLASVMERVGEKTVDFLKVDVEGAEVTVLRSNDWHRFRPSIVLVEAIHPVTHAPSHAQWEWVLQEAGYTCLHFDGVNRYYWNVSLPQPDASCFLPPNALDNVTPYLQLAAEARASEAARAAQFERQKVAEIEVYLSQRLIAEASRLKLINEALIQFVDRRKISPPDEAIRTGWAALISILTSDEVIASLEETIKLQAAKLLELRADLEKSRAECNEHICLLKVSERRRLALLDSYSVAEAKRDVSH